MIEVLIRVFKIPRQKLDTTGVVAVVTQNLENPVDLNTIVVEVKNKEIFVNSFENEVENLMKEIIVVKV